MGAMDLQQIQYRELRKGLQVWRVGMKGTKGSKDSCGAGGKQ